MRVVVTGGAGFIGSAVVAHYVAAGAQVANVDCLTYSANPDSLLEVRNAANYSFAPIDVRDGAALRALLFRFEPDAIIHLAAESHVDRSIDGAAQFIATNVVGTHALLDAALAYWQSLEAEAKGRFRFHHVSTDEVYGSLGDDGAFDERSPYAPNSPYAASKAASDHLVRAWGHTYGLPVLISNCSNNYGPRQFPEKLIPLTILNALEGRPLPVYGNGANVRDWLHVEDHVRAIATIVERGRPGETYNVGGRAERRNLDVVRTICALLDEMAPKAHPHADLIAFVPDRPGHDHRYAVDCSKLMRELGWTPLVDFETGLRRTVSWYLENRWWWERVRSGVYAGERLGLRSVEPV